MLWTFNITPVPDLTPAGAALPSWKQPRHTGPVQNASQTPHGSGNQPTPLQPRWCSDLRNHWQSGTMGCQMGQATECSHTLLPDSVPNGMPSWQPRYHNESHLLWRRHPEGPWVNWTHPLPRWHSAGPRTAKHFPNYRWAKVGLMKQFILQLLMLFV